MSGESNTSNNCSTGVQVDVGGSGGTAPELVVVSPSVDDDTPDAGAVRPPGTTFYFEVETSGRSCLRAGGFVSCNDSRVSIRNWSINGIRVTLVASRNDDDSWTLDDVEPEPD